MMSTYAIRTTTAEQGRNHGPASPYTRSLPPRCLGGNRRLCHRLQSVGHPDPAKRGHQGNQAVRAGRRTAFSSQHPPGVGRLRAGPSPADRRRRRHRNSARPAPLPQRPGVPGRRVRRGARQHGQSPAQRVPAALPQPHPRPGRSAHHFHPARPLHRGHLRPSLRGQHGLPNNGVRGGHHPDPLPEGLRGLPDPGHNRQHLCRRVPRHPAGP